MALHSRLRGGMSREQSSLRNATTSVANDKDSPDDNAAQLKGKCYFAATAADVGPAFQALQNEVIRLSK